jgi:hypothetical protein
MWATYVIIKPLPKVCNRPIDENSPNLVTLPNKKTGSSIILPKNFTDKEGAIKKFAAEV